MGKIHTGTNSSDEIPSEYPESENKITVHRTHRTQNSTERDAVYLRKLEPFIIQAADLFHDIMADSRSLGLHFQVVFFVFFWTWGPMVEDLCSTMSHPLAPVFSQIRVLFVVFGSICATLQHTWWLLNVSAWRLGISILENSLATKWEMGVNPKLLLLLLYGALMLDFRGQSKKQTHLDWNQLSWGSWTTAYRRPWVLVGFGGADNVLGCPPYKIFSWTCCYAIHSSLAPYPGTRHQLLLVTCRTLLMFALLFLGGGFGGGADNVLGCPPYKIFSWTCCYAIHSSLAPYPGTRYQLLLITCKTLLMFAFLFIGGGFWGGLITFLAGRLLTCNIGNACTQSLAPPKIEDIRKEKWPSQNESRFAFNDPAMDVASIHPLKQIVWLHCKMTKKHIFPHLITRWSRFNRWHGCVKDPKWTGMLWPL